ncbi:hypothetical protein Tco_0128247 [Tanacetum coccineum]
MLGKGEGSGQPTKPQHTPTTASPSHIASIPNVASSSHLKKTHKNRKTKRKATEISQSSGPTTLVVDETVHEERGDIMERAATIAASLDAEQDSGNIIRTQSMETLNEPIPQGTGSGSGPRRQDTILGDRPAQTRFERLSEQSNDPPLSRVNTLGSGEDSMKLNELMEICTRLSERVLSLENFKTAQDLEITNLNKRVKKLEKKTKLRTSQLKRRSFKVRIKSSVEKKDVETHGRYGRDIEINTASTSITTASINITTAEPVTTASAPITTARVSISIAQTLMKMKSMMEADYELAQRIQAEEQRELTIKERLKLFVELMDKRKKHFAKLRVNDFVPMDTESSGKKNVEDDAKKAELKACLEIVPGDDSAVNIESLATKYPIVDWKTHILAEDKMYYQNIRADGSTKYYKIFSAMLDDFDRQDVLDLYRLIKERFETTSLEGYDRLLWGDLITLFEPSEEDEIWKAQQDYTLIAGVMIISAAGYVSTTSEGQRKYSMSLLLLVVKLLLLVLVTTARRVSVVRV